jgi:oligo-1,6-glucosidase
LPVAQRCIIQGMVEGSINQTEQTIGGIGMTDWWKKSVVYQVYPRSFMDASGDGIGDLKGITQKLDYLADLGVDVIWLSPIYQSGGTDAGYDISDYYKIEPEFGTMADFDEMLGQAHRLGLKIIMDLVVNHTSDKHAWFKESRSDKGNPKRDYYIWRDGHEGQPPNQLMGYFCEPAWQYDPQTGQYYMHLFTVGQPDLNWENPQMREEIHTMMNWWLQKGIDGFRMDVINCISKPLKAVANDGGPGMACENGPKVHDYLREMHQETFSKYDCITVGETPGVTPGDAIRYAGFDSNEVNMVFQFELMHIGNGPQAKWTTERYNLLDMKDVVTRWQERLYNKAWNSLYLGNHDQPRCVSRWGNDSTPLYWEKSAKMLCTFLHMLQGTPYVFQGDELGMTNVRLNDLSEARDVEIFNAYHLFVTQQKVFTHDEMMANINARGRDNARTPMQWNGSKGAGFTQAEPWIKINENHTSINAQQQVSDPDSIFNYYKRVIRLRKAYDIITTGRYKLLDADNPSVYTYLREDGNAKLLVLCNFTEKEQPADYAAAFFRQGKFERLIGNSGPEQNPGDALRAYEARVYLLEA